MPYWQSLTTELYRIILWAHVHRGRQTSASQEVGSFGRRAGRAGVGGLARARENIRRPVTQQMEASVSPVRSMLRTCKVGTLATVVAITTTAAAVTGATTAFGSPRDRPAQASVTGSAVFRLPYLQDADIRSLTFDSYAVPFSRPIPGVPGGLPTDARGTVKISHYSAQRDITYTAEGAVDCLVTAPGSASLTAVITKVSAGGRTGWGSGWGSAFMTAAWTSLGRYRGTGWVSPGTMG